jgi:predicted transcriptional regulator
VKIRTETDMRLSDIKDILRAEVVVGKDKLDMTIRAGAASDLMSDLLWGPTTDVVLLTGLNNPQVIRGSVISGVAAVVMVRGKRPNKEVISQAEEHDLPLLSTSFTMFSACGRLFGKGLKGVEFKPRSAAPEEGV